MYDVRNMSAPLHTMHFGCNKQLFVRWIFFFFDYFSAAVDGKRARVWLSFAWYETYTRKCSASYAFAQTKWRSTFTVVMVQWCNVQAKKRICIWVFSTGKKNPSPPASQLKHSKNHHCVKPSSNKIKTSPFAQSAMQHTLQLQWITHSGYGHDRMQRVILLSLSLCFVDNFVELHEQNTMLQGRKKKMVVALFNW